MMFIGCEEDPPPPPPPQPGDSFDNPMNRVESNNLGNMTNMTDTNSSWKQLLNSIESTGKYINLDLSACTMTGTSFDPDASYVTGKNYIVSLILPDSTTEISTGSASNNLQAFNGFYFLSNISGKNISTIGYYAFASSTGICPIKTANFPKLEAIMGSAFGDHAGTGGTTTFILGATAPYLLQKVFIFRNDNPYTVKIKVPLGASGYTPLTGTSVTVSGDNSEENWANGFRRMGWNNNTKKFLATNTTAINQKITLIIEQQE